MNYSVMQHLLDFSTNIIKDIGIAFAAGDLNRWNRALSKIEVAAIRVSNEIPRNQSIDYATLIVRKIMSRQVMNYPTYHPRYSAWKEQRSGGGFWNLYGDLVRNMTHQKIESNVNHHSWFAGVPKGIMDSGNKSWFSSVSRRRSSLTARPKEIAWYGRIMELGGKFSSQTHPARPLFEPTLSEYLGNGAIRRAENACHTLAGYWR